MATTAPIKAQTTNTAQTSKLKTTGDFVYDARQELAGMLADGMKHPSTKPVLGWAALGAVAGAFMPFVTIGMGLTAGAGYKFYKRVRPD